MKIAIGCDHGGFMLKNEVKNYLEKNGYEVNRELTYAGGSKLAYNIKGGLWIQNMAQFISV